MIERRERFQQLYDAGYGPVLGYARRRTDTIDDAHDVVSETFMTAWRRLDEVPEGERARLWLFGVARRNLANHHRGRRRYRDLSQRLQREPASSDDVAAAGLGGMETVSIAAAFERLSESDQDVLVMAGWEQLDAGQIAEVLGCSRPSARVRLHRARKRFTAALAAEGLKRSVTNGHEPSRRAPARPDSKDAL